MRKAFKSTLALAASAALVAGVVVTPSISSAWGDNGGGRRSYTIDQINHGILGNKVVFNSISDSVIGDEKNFVGARENTGVNAGANNVWNGNDITVENGKEYLIRLYVHNNNPNGYDAIARDTKVAFSIPTESGTRVQVNGFINSSNATPSKYWDYVNFNSDKAFHLEYVYGSALLENNGVGKNGGIKLSDDIVTKADRNGTLIGFDKLDGNVPGCYGFASYVTIRVKAVYDTDYTINQRVRIAGTKEWKTNVNAQVGDKVEFQVEYKNIGENQRHTNVMIKDVIADNLQYVPGSTILYNSNHPNGAVYNEDTLTTTGVNIGNYQTGANAFVRFTAIVVDKSLECGSNTLVNWMQGGVGRKTIQDYATVMLNKPCEKPEAEEHNLTVNYVYADTGKKAADSYTSKLQKGDSFKVESPKIEGYTASETVISGTMQTSDLTYTVKYTRIPKEYTVRVDYIFEDGNIAAGSYLGTYKENSPFDIPSPVIEGYTPSQETVKGTVVDKNLVYTVVYKKDVKQYHVRINYVYEDGSVAADPYDVAYTDGTEYNVISPIIDGYTADYPEVTGEVAGRDVEFTVTYTKNQEPTNPGEPTEKPKFDKDLPNTGPEAFAGSVLALGSIVTSAGYYTASRRALRK